MLPSRCAEYVKVAIKPRVGLGRHDEEKRCGVSVPWSHFS